MTSTATLNGVKQYSNLSLEQLHEKVVGILRETEHLAKENELLRNYLKNSAPQALNMMMEDSAAGGTTVGGTRQLTSEQKMFIATRELEGIQAALKHTNEQFERTQHQLRALREATEIRTAEAKKEAYEFKRDIVSTAVNPVTGKLVAEKVLKYFDDCLAGYDATVKKLKIKNMTLKAQTQKLEAQLKSKEEMGEIFMSVDFDQLKIENQQYLAKIDERNSELLTLKVSAGKCVQELNNFKRRLHQLAFERDAFLKEIKVREDTLAKFADERTRVDEELRVLQSVNRRLRQQREEYRMPQVLEYVKQKAELYELEKKVKDWERKVELAQMALSRARRKSGAASAPSTSLSLLPLTGTLPGTTSAVPRTKSVDGYRLPEVRRVM